MKVHRIIMPIVAIMASAVTNAQGPRQRYTPFYTREQAPHIENVIPQPPSTSDPKFFYDWTQYQWGKSIRETERGQQAVEDAGINASYFMKRFSPALSYTITREQNPVLYELLNKAHHTESQAGASAKEYFARVRPYQQFKEPTGLPGSENPTDFTSYPSGHTHAAWLVGMILTSIDPDNTEKIMEIAYEIGQSRVILGYHYQTDVDAGRVAGSITFARLCAMPEFLKMLQAAKDEFQTVKAQLNKEQ